MKIAYYVSGHGFGHISRASELIYKFIEKGVEVHLMTSREKFLTNETVNLNIRNVNTDIGVAQGSSLDIDLEKTKELIKDFQIKKKDLFESEIRYLKKIQPDFIISDSSSFPFLLSNKLGIPSFFIGNFTWDFIYNNYASKDNFFNEYSLELKAEYALCDLAFVLPFDCPMGTFKKSIRVGLVGRKPMRTKEEVRKDIGFKDAIIYFLFSFGAYGLNPERFNYNNLPDNYRIVVSRFEGFNNEKVIRIDDIHYPDLVAACDYVVTKPGYGILCECYFANTPILYTDRGDFAEYPYLVKSIHEYLNGSFISQEELFDLDFSRIMRINRSNFMKKKALLNDGIPEIISIFFK